MQDIISNLKDEARKRMSNPFLSSFFLALASANYKAIFVFASDESYRSKFNYVETVLYPDFPAFFFHFIFIPTIAATFFSFIWPLIDTEISILSTKLENRKKLKLLRENRKEPIDKDEQSQYFEQQDQKISDLNSRMSAIRDRETKLTKESNAKIRALTERAKNQAIQRMADAANASTPEIINIFSLDEWSLRAHNADKLEVAKRIPHLKKIAAVVDEIEKAPLTEDYRKIGNMEWLAAAIGESKEYAINFHEILYALNLAGDILDEGLSFDLRHHDAIPLKRISDLYKMASEQPPPIKA